MYPNAATAPNIFNTTIPRYCRAIHHGEKVETRLVRLYLCQLPVSLPVAVDPTCGTVMVGLGVGVGAGAGDTMHFIWLVEDAQRIADFAAVIVDKAYESARNFAKKWFLVNLLHGRASPVEPLRADRGQYKSPRRIIRRKKAESAPSGF